MESKLYLVWKIVSILLWNEYKKVNIFNFKLIIGVILIGFNKVLDGCVS